MTGRERERVRRIPFPTPTKPNTNRFNRLEEKQPSVCCVCCVFLSVSEILIEDLLTALGPVKELHLTWPIS